MESAFSKASGPYCKWQRERERERELMAESVFSFIL